MKHCFIKHTHIPLQYTSSCKTIEPKDIYILNLYTFVVVADTYNFSNERVVLYLT